MIYFTLHCHWSVIKRFHNFEFGSRHKCFMPKKICFLLLLYEVVFSVISQFCHGFPPPLHQATPDLTSRSTASSKFHPLVILVAWRKRRMGKGDLRRGLGTPLLQRAVPHLLTRVMMQLGPLMFQTTSQLTTSQWRFKCILSSVNTNQWTLIFQDNFNVLTSQYCLLYCNF